MPDISCPKCGTELEVPDHLAGKPLKCPDCGARIGPPAADEGIQAGPAKAPAVKPVARPAGDDDWEKHERRPRRYPREAGSDDVVSTLIPYRNVLALVAYYVAIFSLIPCLGVLLGPAAVVLGLLGLRHAAHHPGAKGQAHAWVGIILGGLTALANLAGIVFVFFMGASFGRR